MALLKKNWQKRASDVAVNALMRAGGAGLSAFALTKLTEDESTNLKKTIKNISSPIITAVAVLGDMMFENENLRAFCQGVASYSFLKTVSILIPSAAAPLGLNGIDDSQMPAIMNGLPIMNGAQILNGTDEYTTADMPEEIAQISQGADQNGQVFAQVADYIEQGADDAIQVDTADSDVQGLAASML